MSVPQPRGDIQALHFLSTVQGECSQGCSLDYNSGNNVTSHSICQYVSYRKAVTAGRLNLGEAVSHRAKFLITSGHVDRRRRHKLNSRPGHTNMVFTVALALSVKGALGVTVALCEAASLSALLHGCRDRGQCYGESETPTNPATLIWRIPSMTKRIRMPLTGSAPTLPPQLEVM
jgi:hypothetical protein